MKKNLLIVLCFGFAFLTAQAQDGTWLQKADFASGGASSARESAIAFTIFSRAYIGLGNSGGGVNGTLWQYDTAANTWTQKANITAGGARQGAVCFVVNGKAYVGTGENATFTSDKKFYEYDPNANVWTEKADFAGTARTEAVAFAIGNKGYVGTGYDGVRKKDFWEYDATANTWTQKADFGGTARRGAVGFAVKGKGYIATGNDGARKKDVWQYDPSTNLWTQKNDFGGAARELAVAFTVNDIGYIATGDSGTGNKDVWEYDAETDRWIRKTDLPGDRRYAAAVFTMGSHAYLGTGFSDAGAVGASKSDLWRFTPYKLAAPSLFPISYVSSNALRIRWDYPSGATTQTFEVLRSTNGLDFTTVGIVDGNALDYLDKSLANNQTYYYRMRAVSGLKTSALSNIVSAQTQPVNMGTWTAFSDNSSTPVSDQRLNAFSINNIIYMPFPVTSSTPANVVWAFDPETQAWTEKATGPTPRINYCTFVLNGKAYLATGAASGTPLTVYKDVWQYDPAANLWTQKADFPGAGRHNAFSFVINGKAYLGGGHNSSANTQSDFWEYNPDTDTWTAKASLPETSYSKGFSLQGKGYAGIGASSKGMIVYNPATDAWTIGKGMPFSSRLSYFTMQIKALNGRVYMLTFLSSRNVFWEYIASEDRFVELDMPDYFHNNHDTNMETAGGYLYFLQGGGYSVESVKYDADAALANVSGFRADVIDAQRVRLSWTGTVDGTTHLKIFRSPHETSGYEEVKTLNGRPLEYVDEVVATAGPLYYKIQAFSINGSSRQSKAVTALPIGAWKKLNAFPGSFDSYTAAATSAKGYFGLSSSSISTVDAQKAWWEYDDVSDSWTQKANFAGVPRAVPVSMSIADKIYVGLGQTFDTSPAMLKDFWQYDPAANAWTKKNDFSGPARKQTTCVAFNDAGYMVMGVGEAGTTLKDIWRYDAAADTWSSLPDFPDTPTRSPLVSFYNNELIVMNGYVVSGTTASGTRMHYRLSLSDNTWKKGPLPASWASAESPFFTIGETLYATASFSGMYMLSYHIPSGEWRQPYMPSMLSARAFALKNKAYFMTSNREVWVFDPQRYVAGPTNLTSELKDGHLIIKWQNNSSVPVKTVLEYLSGNNFIKIAEVADGKSEYEFSGYKLNTHYYIRAYSVNEQNESSPVSNITTVHTGPHWSKIANVPVATRFKATIQGMGNSIYYGLGYKGSDANPQKDVWVYDEATGIWTQKADFPGKERQSAESFVLGNSLYVGMGLDLNRSTLADLYQYDEASNSWSASVSFPKNGYARFSVFTHNGNAYFVGGQVDFNNSSTELYRFNGTTWTQLSSIPGDPRADPIAFVANGKAYVGGGQKIVNGSFYAGNAEFFEYDIASDQWKKLADLPHAPLQSAYGGSFSYVPSDFAYVFVSGGAFKYTPANDTWSSMVTGLYPNASNDVVMGLSNSGLAYWIVGSELWRFDPLVGGPTIASLTNPAIRTVTVQWNEIVPQADSVYVERGEAEDGAFIKVAVAKSGVTATDVVPEGGKDYFYRIRAFRGGSNARLSAVKKIFVATPPAGPTLSILYDEGNARLTWTAIAGATQYGLERSINDEPFTALATVTGTSYTDPLPEQQKYTYRVYAINPETKRSNEVFLLITGTEESYASGFSIYPNPAAEVIEVQVPDPGNYRCTMLNSNGKALFRSVVKNRSRINITSYPAGIYFVTLQPEHGTYTRIIKVIKK